MEGRSKNQYEGVRPEDGRSNSKPETIDQLLEETGSCGKFQAIFVACTFSSVLPAVWSVMMLSFLNYSPEWVCADEPFAYSDLNTFSNDSNDRMLLKKIFPEPGTEPAGAHAEREEKNASDFFELNGRSVCNVTTPCKKIQFESSVSTIVTEFTLVCDRAWVLSIITSINMVGLLIGSIVSGQVGDRFGRKACLYGTLVLSLVANVAAVFSVSWEMFAVTNFFSGVSAGSLLSTCYVFNAEFLNNSWRAYLGVFPFWNLGAFTYAAAAMILKDWKYLHIGNAVISAGFLLPFKWVPESMRFLAVRDQIEKAEAVARKISRLNKRPMPNTEVFSVVAKQGRVSAADGSSYSYLDLFHKDIIKPTVVLGTVWLCMSIIYYSVAFGMGSLSGDFFVNLMLFTTIGVPAKLVSVAASKKIGRKTGTVLFLSLSGLSCFGGVANQLLASGETKAILTTVFGFAAIAMVETGWGIVAILNVELFPTPVRNLSTGWVNSCARVGAIAAPYIIPKEGFPLYASFAIMGSLMVICCAGLLTLSETKGQQLPDNFTQKKMPGSPTVELEFPILHPLKNNNGAV